MSVLISISALDLDDGSLQELTRRLCQDLHDETGVEASLATELAGSGTKSGNEVEIIGQVLIKAVGAGGAIVALVNVLKAYVARKPSLQFKIRKKSGDTIEINAGDLRGDNMTKLIQTIEKAF